MMSSARETLLTSIASRLALLLAVSVAGAYALASTADAAEISSFSAGLVNSSDLRAGAHADVNTTFGFTTELGTIPGSGPFNPCFTPTGRCEVIRGGAAKDIIAELPPGFIGNPSGLLECTQQELTFAICPPGAQAGISRLGFIVGGSSTVTSPAKAAIFNMVPGRGEVARFGIYALNTVSVSLSISLRPDDQRIVVNSNNINSSLPLYSSNITIWGNPNDPLHDPDRACPGGNVTLGCSAVQPVKPLLANGAECGVEATTTLRVNTYQAPDVYDEATSTPQMLTGCEVQSFHPGIDVKPTTNRADSPSGLEVSLTVPQNWESPTAVATPPLKRAEVRLPEGVSINPSQADGLGACSDAQIAVGTAGPVGCPPQSKIGDVEVKTPLLEEQLSGALFLGTQIGSDPQSGDMYRTFLAIQNHERGILMKLPGQIEVDSETGQITAVFDDNPQLPFSELKLSLKAGPRAPLATPTTCGTYTTEAELTSWATGMDPVELSSSFEITEGPNGGPCPAGPQDRPFAPVIDAGLENAAAGSSSPFSFRLDRPDGHQELSSLKVDLPEGLTAKLAGVAKCPDTTLNTIDDTPGTGTAENQNPSCPASSQVGVVTVGAGSGPHPFYVQTGKAYLAGPYKGAPLSLAVVVPALAGPFDLGTTLVRNKLDVDPRTAQVSVVSDELPQIIAGVPIRLRDVRVRIDRPQFMRAPTNCEEMRIASSIQGSHGKTATPSSRFQVGGCASLGFRPRLTMRLTGKGKTRTGTHPGLKTILTQGAGQANIARARVALPKSVVLDPRNSTDPALVCDYDKGQAADCPASSVIGKATARTPLLNRPLTGNVHLVQGIRIGAGGRRIRTLPTLLVKLRGELDIDLRARTTVRNNRLVTVFDQVPDAQVSRFDLRINGGSKGILVITRTARSNINICNSKQTAGVRTRGQNGRQANYNTRIKTPCANKAKKAKRRASRR